MPVDAIASSRSIDVTTPLKRFVAENAKRLRLIRLPGYCTELHPNELLNQDVKMNVLDKSRPGPARRT
ncbi:MAG: hypothetical protein VB140_06565 [Burkholderia sp.]